MLSKQISINLPGTSPKLQPSFPIDPRSDILILFTPSAPQPPIQLKLRKAYLKCWSKFFHLKLLTQTSTLSIAQPFNPTHFTNVMSTFYGHIQSVTLQQLPSYLTISVYLSIDQLTSSICNHLTVYHDQFDILQLFKLSSQLNVKQLKQFTQSILFNHNFDDITKRKDVVLNYPPLVFASLMQYISKNMNRQSNINWRLFNNLLMKYSNNQTDPQLYLRMRNSYIDINSLSAEEYSLIFVGEIKLPPKPKSGLQMSQVLESKSVFFESTIVSEFGKILERHGKNVGKYDKLGEKLRKLEEKSQGIMDGLGKSEGSIRQLEEEMGRIRGRERENQVAIIDLKSEKEEEESHLSYSESKPFVEINHSIAEPLSDKSFSLKRQSSGIDDKLSSQQPLTFSTKSQFLDQHHLKTLQKLLGFDHQSRGYLNRIFKADANTTKQDFLSSINSKQDLVFLIYIFQDNKFLGIYTSARINVKEEFNEDYEAFIFNLTDGVKHKSKNPGRAIRFLKDGLIAFGGDIELATDVLKERSLCKWPVDYEGGKGGKEEIKGLVGHEEFHVSELEVFEIMRIDIQMDMDI